jgi:hypothetical protein
MAFTIPIWDAPSFHPCYHAGTKKPRKKLIPESLRAVYANVAAKAVELRGQGMTHPEVYDELNRLGFRTRTGQPWRHPAQIIKLLRSFGGG